MGNPIPNLVYVSREKRPTSAHNFKAGALNALVIDFTINLSNFLTEESKYLLLIVTLISHQYFDARPEFRV